MEEIEVLRLNRMIKHSFTDYIDGFADEWNSVITTKFGVKIKVPLSDIGKIRRIRNATALS